jgi:hypothetical protein
MRQLVNHVRGGVAGADVVAAARAERGVLVTLLLPAQPAPGGQTSPGNRESLRLDSKGETLAHWNGRLLLPQRQRRRRPDREAGRLLAEADYSASGDALLRRPSEMRAEVRPDTRGHRPGAGGIGMELIALHQRRVSEDALQDERHERHLIFSSKLVVEAMK